MSTQNWPALQAGPCLAPLGVKLLSSKDAKKAYVHVAAAGLRMKDSIMEATTTVQENAADILASAKDRTRLAQPKKQRKLPLPIWKAKAKKSDIRRGAA